MGAEQGDIKRFGVVAGVGGDFPGIDFAQDSKILSTRHFSIQLEPRALPGGRRGMLDSV